MEIKANLDITYIELGIPYMNIYYSYRITNSYMQLLIVIYNN